MKLKHCVYILHSLKDKKQHIGHTTDLKRRLTAYFHGHSKSTSCRRPFKLIFCEHFYSKKDAMRRE
jgi:predicted GIY-YIG superfamily endonuclease